MPDVSLLVAIVAIGVVTTPVLLQWFVTCTLWHEWGRPHRDHGDLIQVCRRCKRERVLS